MTFVRHKHGGASALSEPRNFVMDLPKLATEHVSGWLFHQGIIV
jgi:hypothetical protein